MEIIAYAVPAVAGISLVAGLYFDSRSRLKHFREQNANDLLRAKRSLDANTDYDASEVPMVRTPLDVF